MAQFGLSRMCTSALSQPSSGLTSPSLVVDPSMDRASEHTLSTGARRKRDFEVMVWRPEQSSASSGGGRGSKTVRLAMQIPPLPPCDSETGKQLDWRWRSNTFSAPRSRNLRYTIASFAARQTTHPQPQSEASWTSFMEIAVPCSCT